MAVSGSVCQDLGYVLHRVFTREGGDAQAFESYEPMAAGSDFGFRPRSLQGEGKVIGSSEQVHVVDALAMIGDEGRDSLRKATGSRQMGVDPWISEWGNPARKGHRPLNP